MRNKWVDKFNVRRFATGVRSILYDRYGTKRLEELTKAQLTEVMTDIKKMYVECGKPPCKLSDIAKVK